MRETKKPKPVVAKPQEFRGRLWCVVDAKLYCYTSQVNFPGAWVEQSEFKVTGPNAAGIIFSLYQQRANTFPVVVLHESASTS